MRGDSLQKYGSHEGNCRPMGTAWRGREEGGRKGRGGSRREKALPESQLVEI